MFLTEKTAKKLLPVAIAILIAVLSGLVLYRLAAGLSLEDGWTAQLDRYRDNALRLTASSAASSAAITVLPGDVATPIATELAQMSDGFLIVLCALYLEKFIVSISFEVVFKWMIPLICFLFIFEYLRGRDRIYNLTRRAAVLALALLLVIPISLKLSSLVEERYEATINEVIDSAENSAEQIRESVDSNADESAGDGLNSIVRNLKRAGDKIANGTTQLIDYFEKLVSRFVEAAAIMIVVSCLIPLLVIFVFYLIIKGLFSFDVYNTARAMQLAMKEKGTKHKAPQGIGGPGTFGLQKPKGDKT